MLGLKGKSNRRLRVHFNRRKSIFNQFNPKFIIFIVFSIIIALAIGAYFVFRIKDISISYEKEPLCLDKMMLQQNINDQWLLKPILLFRPSAIDAHYNASLVNWKIILPNKIELSFSEIEPLAKLLITSNQNKYINSKGMVFECGEQFNILSVVMNNELDTNSIYDTNPINKIIMFTEAISANKNQTIKYLGYENYSLIDSAGVNIIFDVSNDINVQRERYLITKAYYLNTKNPVKSIDIRFSNPVVTYQ